MNRDSVNGAGFNSRALASVLLASVTLAGSAGVVATGSHVRDAAATVATSGLIQAAATRTKLATASLPGQATLFGRAGQTSQCQATLTCTGRLTAYVLRDVKSSALITGAATLTAIPASDLGEATVSATGTLTGVATRVQHAATDATSSTLDPVFGDCLTADAGAYLTTDFGPYQTSEVCSGQAGVPHATLTGSPWVTRNVQANPTGTATLYAEPGLTYCGAWSDVTSWDDTATWAEFPCYVLQEAYPRLLALADITVSATGILHRMGAAAAVSEAHLTADAFVIQPGRTDVSGTGETTISAEGTILIGLYGYLTGTATLAATGERITLPTAALPAAATLTGNLHQLHQGADTLTGTGTLSPTGTRYAAVAATLNVAAGMTAMGVRELRPTASTTATAVLTALPDTTWRAGAADLSATATLAPTGVRELRPTAELTATATLAPAGVRWAMVTADLPGSAILTDLGVRELRPTAALTGVATATAEGYTNITVDDPSTCVLVRSATTTDFIRPEGATDFVRTPCA